MTTREGAVPEVRLVTGYSRFEEPIGFSRAVVVQPGAGRVIVAGTTGMVLDGSVEHAADAYGQLLTALRTVDAVLREAGTDLAHVVRTRMYVVGQERCDDAGRAHAEVFGRIRPAATMVVVAGLIDPAMVVEIEVEAVLPGEPG